MRKNQLMSLQHLLGKENSLLIALLSQNPFQYQFGTLPRLNLLPPKTSTWILLPSVTNLCLPPPRPPPRTFHDEATRAPTLWPRFNANFPFQLFDAFVQETDDHRFENHTNGNFLDEGMSYLAKVSCNFLG